MPIIYIDVLILTNFIFDTALLLLAGTLSGREIRPLKLLLGGVFGGIYSAFVFFPDLSFLSANIVKILASAAMVWLSFFPLKKAEFWRLIVNFYIVSFLLAGGLSALFFLSGKPAVMSNGIYYFPMTFLRLVTALLPLSAVLFYVWKKSKNRLYSLDKYCFAQIGFGGKIVTVPAIIDSGCSLYDPYINRPVIIIDKSVFGDTFANFRLIPYKTIDSTNLLPAFTPDFCKIILSDREQNVNCCIAVSSADLNSKAIINPDVFINKI